MAFLSSETKTPGSIFPLSASDSRVRAGSLSVDVETTGHHESIRASRALGIIHGLECLIRSQALEVLETLKTAEVGHRFSAEIRKTLGNPMYEALCVPKRGGSNTSLMECSVGLIEDVLKHLDNDENRFSVQCDKYQEYFAKVAATKPKIVGEVMNGLIHLRDSYPDDFKKLRGMRNIETGSISLGARGVLGAFNLAMPNRMIEPAQELLVIGFDPDTDDLRIDMPK